MAHTSGLLAESIFTAYGCKSPAMSDQKGPIALVCCVRKASAFCESICTWRVQRTPAALSVTRLPSFSVWTGTLLWAAVLCSPRPRLSVPLALSISFVAELRNAGAPKPLGSAPAEKAAYCFPVGFSAVCPHLELVPKSNKCHLKSSVSPPGP